MRDNSRSPANKTAGLQLSYYPQTKIAITRAFSPDGGAEAGGRSPGVVGKTLAFPTRAKFFGIPGNFLEQDTTKAPSLPLRETQGLVV